MSTNTRITRSKGESHGLSLLMRTRPTRKETILGKDGGTVLNTTFNAGLDQHHQKAPTHMPQLPAQSPQANPVRMTKTPVPMLSPGQHRPLTPHTPLPTSTTSGSQLSQLSAPLFKEDRYSSTSEEETEAEADVKTNMGPQRAHGPTGHDEACFWVCWAYRIDTPTGHRNTTHPQYIIPTRWLTTQGTSTRDCTVPATTLQANQANGTPHNE